MVLATILDKIHGKELTDFSQDISFDGVYCGDLLSRCMSHVVAGNLWLTIMNNINTIAVASLTEAAAVVLVEGVTLPDDVLAIAKEKMIPVFTSDLSVYDICVIIGKEV